ncbi:MAG: phosphoribosylanthranilate isomerase [Candidatus Omnitrophota bacterium]|nr:phosphoribosylanthranilate isomerase [Candidatus Omnitrophota bacterium]
MTKIKICGITNKKDAVEAAELGADMLGFVCYKKSKRYVEPKTIMDIANELPDRIAKVGVFVDEEAGKVSEIAQNCLLDTLQFHGDESPEYCARFKGAYKIIKAFKIKDKDSLKGINDYDVDFYMLDTHSDKLKGGTGKSFDWKIIENFEFLRPVILSGGLNPSNVGQAIDKVFPYGVDVSSGIEESPGKKDLKLMKEFVENVRKSQ